MALAHQIQDQKYCHLFFDLDHTLWDYDKNAKETLAELYDEFNFDQFNLFTKEDFANQFFIINNQLWYAFNNGRTNKDEIRNSRFPTILKLLGLKNSQIPTTIGDDFISRCPTKNNLVNNCLEILEYLKPKYDLHIITNGFNDVQHTKLDFSNLTPYFRNVITSESTGYKKPQREIFDHALKVSNANHDESIMIGDNLNTDILGARNCNIDQLYFNPAQIFHQESVTFEVSKLLDLKELF
jgi:putative hydrolase of the HAD superfamily